MVVGERSSKRTVGESRLFRRAVDAAGHSIYFTNEHGIIEYVNPAFEAVTGYTAEEAIGRTPRILKSGEHDAAFYDDLWSTILAGAVWRNRLINERKSGEWYVVDQTIAPVKDDAGDITHFVAVNVDVTDRYSYERQLESQNERLDEFSSILGHDVKNFLTVAIGNTALVRETGDLSLLADVQEAHDRMVELTDDVLALARAGRSIDAVEPVALPVVTREAWTTVRGDDASLVVENGDVEILADRARLKQALENLFRNAITHGGEDVTVRVGIDGSRLYIEDDGAGIPGALRERVFEKGYTSTVGGTGFGLTIIRNIVEAHGWDITVRESRDGGARFEITGINFELMPLS